jgi:hypothetical protein
MLMNATANRPRQQRQMLVLGILIVALAVIVGIQVMPLLEGTSTPPPRPITAAPAATARPAPTAPKTKAPATAGRQTRATPSTQSAKAATGNAVLAGVEEVHLAKLQEKEPEPIDGHRNPFTFGPDPKVVKQQAEAAAERSKQQAIAAATPPPPVSTGPPAPPPPPPITLKFFGVVTGPGRVGKVAALGDGKFVYHGREGEIVEGRYRIVKIGEESIQLEYVDGRGRQTIRLSGK